MRWSSRRSEDARLTAFCRIEGAVSKGGEEGDGAECSERPTCTDPEKTRRRTDFVVDFVLKVQPKESEDSVSVVSAGPVHGGLRLPPSMRRAL